VYWWRRKFQSSDESGSSLSNIAPIRHTFFAANNHLEDRSLQSKLLHIPKSRHRYASTFVFSSLREETTCRSQLASSMSRLTDHTESNFAAVLETCLVFLCRRCRSARRALVASFHSNSISTRANPVMRSIDSVIESDAADILTHSPDYS
jgi:hypothetical protein